MATLKRVSVGFRGGQVLSVRVTEDALSALQGALGGQGWYDAAHDEGSARICLDDVVYVQVDSAEARVGFGV